MRLAGLVAAVLVGAAGAASAEQPASRIVVLAPHLAEIVWLAGAGDKLVGAVEWSDYPEPVQSLPRVGDAFNIDDERLAGLEPDLVLAWSGGNPARAIERLRGRGFRVEAFATTALEDVAGQLLVVGRLAGTEATAEAAAADYREALAGLRAAQAGKPAVRVFYQVSARPLYTVGGDQVITRVLALCGGENVFSDLGQLAAVVDLEAVVARNPEAILAPSGAELGHWARWPELAAVQRGNIFTVNGDLIARPSPRLLDGAARVCDRLDAARAAPSGR